MDGEAASSCEASEKDQKLEVNMKNERTQNAARNITFGVLLQVYRILVPFATRTVMIYLMGVQYLGLHSLFASILQVLNLAELGVGSAMVYSMYKPIAEDDQQTICALMNLYRTYYRAIGLIIGAAGLLLTPLVPKLIKGDLPPELNVYILYWMNLATTCLSYWLFAYKRAILSAHQREDVASKVSIIIDTLQYGLQILVLYTTHNYYAYLMIALTAQALTNVFTAAAAKRFYPQYSPRGQLPPKEVKKITNRIRDLFTGKLGGVVLSSADSIVISSFLGLTFLAVYQNYNFIMTAVINILNVVFSSCMAGIGNSIVTESESKNYRDFSKFSFLMSWVSGLCACCFLNLYQPFIELWVGKDLMLPMQVVICFCIYFYLYEIYRVINIYKDAAGLWHEDRFRPLVTAMANLGMNLLSVRYLGIYGVILSTVLSWVFIGYPWVLHNLFSTLFRRTYLRKYLGQLLYNALVSVLACVLSYLVCSLIQGNLWLVLLIRAVVCVVLPNVVFLVFYHNRTEFFESVILVDKMTRHLFHLERIFFRFLSQ